MILDTVPETQTWYYRVRQTDFDGTVSVSQVVAAEPFTNNNPGSLIIGTSNGNDDVVVYFTSQNETEFSLSVIDVAGRLLYVQNVTALEGQNSWIIPGNIFPRGICFVMLQNNQTLLREKHFR